VAVGDHIQAWLDGSLYLDHRDPRFRSGRVGLWTKADSVTAFDDVVIRGVKGRGSTGGARSAAASLEIERPRETRGRQGAMADALREGQPLSVPDH
jgi:hypothetical protein